MAIGSFEGRKPNLIPPPGGRMEKKGVGKGQLNSIGTNLKKYTAVTLKLVFSSLGK